MYATVHKPYSRFELVVMAASLGGIHTLRTILRAIPADFPAPIVIVQHLTDRSPSRLSETLARECAVPVSWACDGHTLGHGEVLVAPPGQHVRIHPNGTLSLSRGNRVNFVRPSADILFSSAASYAGARTLAVVLTGCGRDGAAGVAAVKRAGGHVLAQDAGTSAAFGMPAAAIAAHCVHFALPLDKIPAALVSLVMVPGAAELLQVQTDSDGISSPGVRQRDRDASRRTRQAPRPITPAGSRPQGRLSACGDEGETGKAGGGVMGNRLAELAERGRERRRRTGEIRQEVLYLFESMRDLRGNDHPDMHDPTA